jgi:hypothetical protein
MVVIGEEFSLGGQLELLTDVDCVAVLVIP